MPKMMVGQVLKVSVLMMKMRVGSVHEAFGFQKLKGLRQLSVREIFSRHSLRITIRSPKVKQLCTVKVFCDIDFN